MKLRIFIGLICFLISSTACFAQVRSKYQRSYQREDIEEYQPSHEYYNDSRGEKFSGTNSGENNDYRSSSGMNSYRGGASRSLRGEDAYSARGENSSDADREPPTDPEEPATIPVDSGVVFLIMAACGLVFYTYYKNRPAVQS